MHIVVTVKQVPNPEIPPGHFRIDPAARKVIPPTAVAPVMNGYDANALEEALRLRDELGGTVSVISLGGNSAHDTLRRALAMGADAVALVTDADLLDGDSYVTARALAAAIARIGPFDLVLSGRQASDTDGGQTHVGIAHALGIPVISPLRRIEAIDDSSATVQRIVDDGYQRIKVLLPALLGVSSEMNTPRYATFKNVMAAAKAQIPTLAAADLGLTGLRPRVEVRLVYIEERDAHVQWIDADSPGEAGTRLADKLREAKLV